MNLQEIQQEGRYAAHTIATVKQGLASAERRSMKLPVIKTALLGSIIGVAAVGFALMRTQRSALLQCAGLMLVLPLAPLAVNTAVNVYTDINQLPREAYTDLICTVAWGALYATIAPPLLAIKLGDQGLQRMFSIKTGQMPRWIGFAIVVFMQVLIVRNIDNVMANAFNISLQLEVEHQNSLLDCAYFTLHYRVWTAYRAAVRDAFNVCRIMKGRVCTDVLNQIPAMILPPRPPVPAFRRVIEA